MKASYFFISLSSLVLFSGCTMNQESAKPPLPSVPKNIVVSGTLLPKDTVSEPVSTGQTSVQSFSGNLK